MRIIQIVPGSGGTFYCQNCLRDHALVRALRAQGHDALLVPLYLPAFADDPAPAGPAPVFYGAVNLYLEHQFPWFRRWPRGLTRWQCTCAAIFDLPFQENFFILFCWSFRSPWLSWKLSPAGVERCSPPPGRLKAPD